MLLGIDVTSSREWRERLARAPAVRAAAFTATERAWCGEDPGCFAVAWAVKEAMVKLLGTGFAGIGWRGVWSRPAEGGVEVALGRDARRVAHAAGPGPGCAAPLRCAVCEDGERVVALLAAGPERVAVRALAIPARADRTARRRSAASAAARRAGVLAARRCCGDPELEVGWSADAGGAPRALPARGQIAATTLAHGAGIALAAVAGGEPSAVLRYSEEKRSGSVMFRYCERLQAEVVEALAGRAGST